MAGTDAATLTKVSDLILVRDWLSVTCTMKLFVPVAEAVPDRLPALFRVKPVGNATEPVASDQA